MIDMRKIVFTLGLLVLGICFLHAQKPELKFGADKTFKIVQFTDVHWIYNDSRSDIAGERMNEVLDAEEPDFLEFISFTNLPCESRMFFLRYAGYALTNDLKLKSITKFLPCSVSSALFLM
jgi:hypothetical protein